MMALTTIQIRKDTRDELKKMGRKGQTYDELITKLLRVAKKDMFFNELDKIADSEEFVSLDEI
jgi:predicted CopG family antitoxin